MKMYYAHTVNAFIKCHGNQATLYETLCASAKFSSSTARGNELYLSDTVRHF